MARCSSIVCCMDCAGVMMVAERGAEEVVGLLGQEKFIVRKPGLSVGTDRGGGKAAREAPGRRRERGFRGAGVSAVSLHRTGPDGVSVALRGTLPASISTSKQILPVRIGEASRRSEMGWSMVECRTLRTCCCCSASRVRARTEEGGGRPRRLEVDVASLALEGICQNVGMVAFDYQMSTVRGLR